MPTYEYECLACGHRFEKFQSMSDPLLKTCPECKAKKLKRLIGTGAGLLFKGEGFYITDYRSKGYQEKAKSEGKGGESGGSGGESGGGASSGGSGDSAASGAAPSTGASGAKESSGGSSGGKGATKGGASRSAGSRGGRGSSKKN